VAAIGEVKEILTANHCQVIVISFGVKKGAQQWKEDANCAFHVYLDPTRKLYSKFGMNQSVAKVWSRQTIGLYVSAKLANVTIPIPYGDMEDDPLQMGGDLIFNSDGLPVLTYLSSTPADRPSVSNIIDFLKNL